MRQAGNGGEKGRERNWGRVEDTPTEPATEAVTQCRGGPLGFWAGDPDSEGSACLCCACLRPLHPTTPSPASARQPPLLFLTLGVCL